MKKTLKRFLSSALAAVMAASVLSVGMVTSASAATETYYYVEAKESKDVVNTDKKFTASNTGSTSGISTSSYQFEGESESRTPTGCVKFNDGATIKYTVLGTATVEVAWSNKGTNTNEVGIKLTDGKGQVHNSDTTKEKNTVIKVSKFTDIPSGEFTIERQTSKELCVYAVKVVDTFEGTMSDFTITGTCNLKNTKFMVGEYEADVDAEGNWTVTENALTSPFAVGDSFDISIAQYTASPTSIKLTAGTDAKNFDGGDIQFTLKDLAPIEAGTYTAEQIMAGRPNFDIDALTPQSGTKDKYTGDLKFILDKPAKVTINAKCGSGTTGKYGLITFGGLENEKLDAGGSFTNYTTTVSAGEQTIKFAANLNIKSEYDTTVQVDHITIEYINVEPKSLEDSKAVLCTGDDSYLIVGVSEEDATAKSELVINVGDQENTTDTVYKSLSIDGQTYDAADFNGSAFVYAVKVAGAYGDTQLETFSKSFS